MEIIKRIDTKTIQRVVTTEQVINIEDLERRRDQLQQMIDIDAQTLLDKQFIEQELDKTSLTPEQKQQALSGFVFSGTGVNQKMVEDMQAEIDALKALPLEAAIDLKKATLKDGDFI